MTNTILAIKGKKVDSSNSKRYVNKWSSPTWFCYTIANQRKTTPRFVFSWELCKCPPIFTTMQARNMEFVFGMHNLIEMEMSLFVNESDERRY